MFVTPDDAPTLLIHGDKDDLVKLDNSERILAVLEKEKVPCELVVIEGARHGFHDKDAKRAETPWSTGSTSIWRRRWTTQMLPQKPSHRQQVRPRPKLGDVLATTKAVCSNFERQVVRALDHPIVALRVGRWPVEHHFANGR